MINTKIHKAVYELAEKLMRAAHKDDRESFEALYGELEAICIDNEYTEKDHPEQWETLADFTEESDEALALYQKALDKAVAKSLDDYIASIGYSMASLWVELEDEDAALVALRKAKASAGNIEDNDLKREIDELLHSLTHPESPRDQ
ncbi:MULTISPECIES: tetratricopeptide repeat protein [unclassified Halomonas]|uniref:tetratricopeptide repeat protein n=1 Tax=unclassified Halomonas TaxID=2609666 RepID=UPI00209D518E|nr:MULTISPECIES: tetratricopeptide repeat protein [unclassified Halomonas]MCP1313688.1 tetratricopeptide repeat protein [Halomonas sp. 707D7]MCP1326049.1 tetratricopeptide repeat protein [Halomonas sp. 707D4]